MRTAGIDGCRAGWLLASLDDTQGLQLIRTEQELASAFRRYDLVFIDMPIGLPEERPERGCDRALRRLLSPGRASSVFSAPLRSMLGAASHAEACEIGRRAHGKGVSLQTWNILPKIRQIDLLFRRDPDLPGKVLESHPEWLFLLAGSDSPPPAGKKTMEGRAQRMEILTGCEPGLDVRMNESLRRFPRREVAMDDVLDAWMLAVAADRARRHGLVPLTGLSDSAPDLDGMGLPMAVWRPARF